MRMLRIIEHISLDGIIQSPGGRTEDGDYPAGGWSMRYSDPVIFDAFMAAQGSSFDLLLGRRTYDIWAGYWPTEKGPIADSFNAAVKYIATHRPESLAWGPAQALGPDIAAGVREIKSKGGRDLILWGSSTITSVLLDQGLVDEVLLITYPVLLGKGKRFFSENVRPHEFALVSSKAGASGVIANTYRPAGPLGEVAQ
jgi:dihydrofolate reductase